MIASPKSTSPGFLQFGGFTLDLQRHGLYCGKQRIHLTSKPLETLIYLIEHRGRTVEKQELLDAIWKNTFVTEDNLVHAVREIRRALEDDKDDPRFVQTVPREGYRFVGEVTFRANAPTSSSLNQPVQLQHLPLENGKGRKRGTIFLSVILLILMGSVITLYTLTSRSPGSQCEDCFQNLNVTRLTTSGKVTEAVMSPDSRYVIYSQTDQGQQSLWLRQLATSSDVQIIAPAAVSYQGLTFSPEGNYFYYVVRAKSQLGTLYRMPTLGGAAKALLVDIDSGPSFSQDGKRFAFYRGYPEKGETVLVIGHADESDERILSSQHSPQFFPTQLKASPSWAPDGSLIACALGNADGNGRYMTIVAVQVSDAQIKTITPGRWSEVGNVAWLQNGRGLLITAKETPSSPAQIWYVPYPEGEPRQVTNDLNGYASFSASVGDPSRLVAIQSSVRSNIVVLSGNNTKEFPVSSVDGVGGVSWTPDGRIVFAARKSGNQDLWIMSADGQAQKQLTSGTGDNNWPSVTSDGRYIVFMSNRTGSNHIWRMNLDGGDSRQLTFGSVERWPRCTPDSRWVVYASVENPRGLYKVPIEGGAPVAIVNKHTTYPAISPDGKLIAAGYFEEPGANKTALYSFEGGEPLKILDLSSFYISFTRDGSGLTYVDRGPTSNILSQTLAGGAAKQLTRFKEGVVLAFDWSRDGRLVYSHRLITSDAVMLTDLTQK